jgi:2-amino-4-hydroxy-6-hydroxymethyldihydropteridine diphosphokinase
VNAVVALETELSPHELLDGLLAIEKEFGRDRAAGVVNKPRTLDLDILLFGDLEISEPNIRIPHPRLAKRAFVLVPLCEITAKVLVPGSGVSVTQLLANLLKGSKVAFDTVVRLPYDTWEAR